jgi:serine/threonine protein kinase
MSTNDVGTTEWLIEEIAKIRLLEREQFEPLVKEFLAANPYADAVALADYLVRADLLTPFQATQLLEESGRSLVLGAYVLVDKLGFGSMGTVYKAVGRADRQRQFAIKVLPQRSIWNVRLVRRQLRAFTDLEAHPTIVQFLDVGTANGVHYLVWEFAEGEPLSEVISRCGPLDPEQTINLAVQLAEGLALCHERGVFHGMLKPSNILIGPNGQVRILDFGVGALLMENEDESLMDTMSTANAAVSILDFAAPECTIDPTNRTAASDQYSLGCILYYCLTGQPPFPEGNAVEKLVAHQTQPPPRIQRPDGGVPPALTAIIDRLLQKSPQARFAQTAELHQSLRALLNQPVSPRPGVPLKPDSKQGVAALPKDAPPLAPPVPVTPLRRSSHTGTRPVPPASLPPLPTTATTPPKPVGISPPVVPSKLPRPHSARSLPLGAKLNNLLLFWMPPLDVVDCTIYSAPIILPGQVVHLQMFTHLPDAYDSVQTLARAFQSEVCEIDHVCVSEPVRRDQTLSLFLKGTGCGIDKPLQDVRWRGQPAALTFAVNIPWDHPGGAVPLTLLIGHNNRCIAELAFELTVTR